MMPGNNTHSLLMGYVLWIFGFLGAHRFYYGKPVTGTLWLCTFGLLGVGWLVDLFLIPGMEAAAERRYHTGKLDYSVAWILLTFFGLFGLHRLYMGKWFSGLLCLLMTLASPTLFFLLLFPLAIPLLVYVFAVLVYDFWTLNRQIDAINEASAGR